MNHPPLRPGGLTLTKQAAEAAELTADSRVLDIGCGMGDSLAWLQQTYGCYVAGIDRSEKAVQKAKAALKCSGTASGQLLAADAGALPFPDADFDLVLMECTLTLFEDPGKALQEALRVLRPDGLLYISALTRKSGPAAGDVLVEQGLLIPDKLESFLGQLGCRITDQTDQNDVLIQFVADIIFTYGSLEEYVRQAMEASGGCVFGCAADARHTGYTSFYVKKNNGNASI